VHAEVAVQRERAVWTLLAAIAWAGYRQVGRGLVEACFTPQRLLTGVRYLTDPTRPRPPLCGVIGLQRWPTPEFHAAWETYDPADEFLLMGVVPVSQGKHLGVGRIDWQHCRTYDEVMAPPEAYEAIRYGRITLTAVCTGDVLRAVMRLPGLSAPEAEGGPGGE